GPLAAPGTYKVRLAKRVEGVETPIGEMQTFTVVPLYLSTMNDADRGKVLDFQRRASRLQKAILGAARATEEALTRVQYIRRAIDQTENVNPAIVQRVNAIDTTLRDINEALTGDVVARAEAEPSLPSLLDRISTAVNGLTTTQPPTNTHRQALDTAEQQFVPLLAKLRQAVEVELGAIERELNVAGAPWTPGRIPVWQ
ncbi:MAG: glycosyl hydrolase, partial [Acidobacteriota bacterium]|nr:glycosyl hydrolase [Acidobacteriota bacterium]